MNANPRTPWLRRGLASAMMLVLVGCTSADGDAPREPLVDEEEEAGLRPTIAVLPFVWLAASTKLHSKGMHEDQILKELRQRVSAVISSTGCCVMLDRRRSADWLLAGEVAEFDVGMTRETIRGYSKTREYAAGRASFALINVATGEKREIPQVGFSWGGPISELVQDDKLQRAKKAATGSTDLLLNWMSLDLADHIE